MMMVVKFRWKNVFFNSGRNKETRSESCVIKSEPKSFVIFKAIPALLHHHCDAVVFELSHLTVSLLRLQKTNLLFLPFKQDTSSSSYASNWKMKNSLLDAESSGNNIKYIKMRIKHNKNPDFFFKVCKYVSGWIGFGA